MASAAVRRKPLTTGVIVGKIDGILNPRQEDANMPLTDVAIKSLKATGKFFKKQAQDVLDGVNSFETVGKEWFQKFKKRVVRETRGECSKSP